MEGADNGNVQPGGLFKNALHLWAVLAHNIGIIAPALIQILIHEVTLVGKEAAVKRAEGTESIGGEKDLFRLVVTHHNLRPVDHRCHDKGELMASERKNASLLDNIHPAAQVYIPEKLGKHGLNFIVADDAGLRMAEHEGLHRGGVIRLHV